MRLNPLNNRFDGDAGDIETVTAAAFGQRRKTLKRSLASLGVPVEALLEIAGVDGQKRAEELDIAAFSSLAVAFSDLHEGL